MGIFNKIKQNFGGKIVNMQSGSCNINGVTYTGNNITIVGGKVIIDGVEQESLEESKVLNIIINGNVDKLESCNEVTVHGDCNSVDSMSGSVTINGNVENGIDTQSGRVEVSGDVGGSVETMSGRVSCGNVAGNIQTMSGNIKHR